MASTSYEIATEVAPCGEQNCHSGNDDGEGQAAIQATTKSTFSYRRTPETSPTMLGMDEDVAILLALRVPDSDNLHDKVFHTGIPPPGSGA